MTSAIPASELVNALPGVLSAGGAAVALNGLVLTANTAIPLGTVQGFASANDAGAFFGLSSVEYTDFALPYFNGFTNSTQKPGMLLFSQYPTASVAAYARSGSFAGVALTDLQAIAPGILTFTVDGVVKNSTSINLSGATSFANAATLITAAFTGGPTVTYDAQRQAFVATSGTTGATSTITFGSGTISTALKFTAATGAVLSQGSVAYTPAAAMASIITSGALNWAAFTTVFEPLIADKLAFATWTSQQNSAYAYVPWDTDPNAVVQGNTTDFGSQAKALGLGGIMPFTGDPVAAASLGITMTAMVRPLAAFALGVAASLNFLQTNGRTTFAFRSQGGLYTGVLNATVGKTLIGKGYNFYGAYATRSQQFMFLQPGQIGGSFKWADSFFNQIWMNGSFQNTLLTFLANQTSVPYTPTGYSSIETAMADPINAALNFGAIRAGVTLSGDQKVAVNSLAGKSIDNVISTRGWYLNIVDPGAAARANRTTPNMTFFYADGGSIQQITFGSINIQ